MIYQVPSLLKLGEVEKVFEVFKLPMSPIPTEVKFSFEDEIPNSKRTPYYIKIQQEDGEKAWSSPIFVNYNE